MLRSLWLNSLPEEVSLDLNVSLKQQINELTVCTYRTVEQQRHKETKYAGKENKLTKFNNNETGETGNDVVVG